MNFEKLFLASILILTNLAGFSQVKFGIKAGLQVSDGVFHTLDNNTSLSLKYHVGILSEIYLGKKFFIRPELLYSVKGWKFNGSATSSETSVNLHYLNVPILFGFRPVPKLSLLAGIEAGYLLNVSMHSKGLSSHSNFYKTFDLGLAIGADYKISSHIGAEIRYVHGFNKLYKGYITDPSGNLVGMVKDGSNRVLQASVFYIFGKVK